MSDVEVEVVVRVDEWMDSLLMVDGDPGRKWVAVDSAQLPSRMD